eukprot:scaffold1402_cov403-Prasinococcus_capsulatus_cf.AAC.8
MEEHVDTSKAVLVIYASTLPAKCGGGLSVRMNPDLPQEVKEWSLKRRVARDSVDGQDHSTPYVSRIQLEGNGNGDVKVQDVEEDPIYITVQPISGFGVIMKGEDMPHTIQPLVVQGVERISLVLSYDTTDGDYCLDNDVTPDEEAEVGMTLPLSYSQKLTVVAVRLGGFLALWKVQRAFKCQQR